MKKLVLTVGNDMMGDDGAGPMLANLMQQKPLDGWHVVDGGVCPENVTGEIRATRPECLLIVDATDMGLNPGEIRFIEHSQIARMMITSTHQIPLSFLIEQLQEDVKDIVFLGIQPETVGFYYPMSQKVSQAIEYVYEHIEDGLKEVPWL